MPNNMAAPGSDADCLGDHHFVGHERPIRICVEIECPRVHDTGAVCNRICRVNELRLFGSKLTCVEKEEQRSQAPDECKQAVNQRLSTLVQIVSRQCRTMMFVHDVHTL